MKYSTAIIPCKGSEEWQIDLLCQLLADLGFDSFEHDGETLRAYIPTDLVPAINRSALNAQLSTFNLQLSTILPCPDQNWNAVWEAEHPVEELPLGVRIVPHCAFGAGHHETTAMMINELIASVTKPIAVFDHGTGTGVLAIFAKRLGADYVLADDIDDNSVRNARDNAELNGVNIDVRPAPIDLQPAMFDLILANIHRNVLLSQMADYARALKPGGQLWMSGFYEQDVPVLTAAAAAYGLQHKATRANAEWRMLMLEKH